MVCEKQKLAGMTENQLLKGDVGTGIEERGPYRRQGEAIAKCIPHHEANKERYTTLR
ncbi:MAG: hypothetical protein OXC66_12010 [Roseovarius sp.]|nr:hypothetical protein [Roseovarius sp.]